MEQGTGDWHNWRLKGIGASDAPAIMGASKTKSLHQLWLEKTGRAEGFKGNFITERGNAIEPLARAAYELEMGTEMRPETRQHFWFTVLRCSMDGINDEIRGGLEIKLVGIDNYELLCAGQIIPEYKPQIMHQLLVCGLEWIDLYGYYLPPELKSDPSWYHLGKTARVRITPDVEYIQEYLLRAQQFWWMVINDIEPDAPVKKSRKKKKEV